MARSPSVARGLFVPNSEMNSADLRRRASYDTESFEGRAAPAGRGFTCSGAGVALSVRLSSVKVEACRFDTCSTA